MQCQWAIWQIVIMRVTSGVLVCARVGRLTPFWGEGVYMLEGLVVVSPFCRECAYHLSTVKIWLVKGTKTTWLAMSKTSILHIILLNVPTILCTIVCLSVL